MAKIQFYSKWGENKELSKFAFEMETLPRDARIFAEKAARTIIEAQDNIESVTDIAILLEIMGVTKDELEQNGFEDIYDLSVYINDFVEFYEVKHDESEVISSFLVKVPSKKKRAIESMAMIFPWIASLALFLVSGVSLWMVSGLPAEDITALMVGVFLGIFITQGPLEVFQRLFVMNHNQLNTSAAKRTMKRNFLCISSILTVTSFLLVLSGYMLDISPDLVLLSVVSLVTVSLHRASYMIVYALRKLKILVVSYSAALAILFLTYYLAWIIIPDTLERYLLALGLAFLSLTVSAVYAYYKTFNSSSKHEAHPSFYKSPKGISNTIKARFLVQMLDSVSYYFLGTFLFIIMFGDRLISWLFNPDLDSTKTSLPLLFNTTYHSGADPAMMVFLATSITQYMIMSGFYEELSNITLENKTTQIDRVDKFLKKRYRKLILLSLATSCFVAFILNYLGPDIMMQLGASDLSLDILTISSIGNVFISIFVANIMFATFMNKVKGLAIIAMFAALILVIGGLSLAQDGFGNTVYAYLASAFVAALLSSLYVMRTIKKAASIYFARFS
ncbi:MAG: hypothetical protein KGI25_05045 [Thaumarchaeota archaeon]|nr:hypothetical protein [Nitrososphaerota archaeon]